MHHCGKFAFTGSVPIGDMTIFISSLVQLFFHIVHTFITDGGDDYHSKPCDQQPSPPPLPLFPLDGECGELNKILYLVLNQKIGFCILMRGLSCVPDLLEWIGGSVIFVRSSDHD